jgi:hypothetical protein
MFRRHQFVTHRRVQFRLASVFILWFVVFLAAFGFLYFLNFSIAIGRTDYMTVHDRILAKSLLVDQALDLALWFGGALVAFVTLVWIYLVVYSHRITGPIYKLENLLKTAVSEEKVPDFELSFRKHDAFHSLAKDFNAFVNMIRSQDSETSTNEKRETSSLG